MKYDYKEAVEEDVREWVHENISKGDYSCGEDLYMYLYDTLFMKDSITGNASGSYFCNASKAEECLMGNLDILADAFEVLGYDREGILETLPSAETCDTLIRSYFLGEAIDTVIEELNDDGFFDEEKEED